MKTITKTTTLIILAFIIFFLNHVNAQDKTREQLMNEYAQANLNHNETERVRIAKEMEKFSEKSPPENYPYSYDFKYSDYNPPFERDWYDNDIQVHTGNVKYGFGKGFRQLDIKQGRDGYLYYAVNRDNIPGYNGGIRVYWSSNGGLSWPYYADFVTSGYISSISMLVETHGSNPDSTRMIVYFTAGSNSNFDNAGLYCLSTRKSGGYYIITAASPSAGHRYKTVTTCSDGMYFPITPFLHEVVIEETNAGAYVGIRHFISLDWSITHSSSLITPPTSGFFANPSCGMSYKNPGLDSIYITAEEVLSNASNLKLIRTPGTPGSSYSSLTLFTAPANVYAEKPCITIAQQNLFNPRVSLITYTRNNVPYYLCSLNGGVSWSGGIISSVLGSNVFYTFCSSDSAMNTPGGNFAICTSSSDGDSIMAGRSGINLSAGAYSYKRNSSNTTLNVSPVCAVYHSGNSYCSTVGYTGTNGTNAYFDSENFITAVTPGNGNVPEKFELKQNYPNPFNPSTDINFSIPKSGFVKIAVYDILGNEVAVLANENRNAGSYKVTFNAALLSSGVYFCKMESNGFSDVKKMMLVK